MLKKKVILTVAASTALLIGIPMQNKAEAAHHSSAIQERVYFYQSYIANEMNSLLESFFQKVGINPYQVQKTTPVGLTAIQEPVPAPGAKPVSKEPVQTEQPKTTETANSLNAYEQEVINLTNQERAKNGLPALQVDITLSKMAREKSRDMSAGGYFSHTSPTYGSPFDMMNQFGITYRYAGENIAMGQRSPQEVVNAWMNSEGHRQNILSPNFTHIGVGYVSQGNYWTQEFIGK